MRLCILAGEPNAVAVSRLTALRAGLDRATDVIEIRPFSGGLTRTGGEDDVFVIPAREDARALVAARMLRDGGARVGIDFTVDTTVDPQSSEFRAWADEMAVAIDFVLLSQEAERAVADRAWPGVAKHVVRDIVAKSDQCAIATSARAAALRARTLKRIDFLWIGDGGRGLTTAGVSRLAAWLDDLQATGQAMQVCLRLLGQTSDPAILAALGRLPVTLRLEERRPETRGAAIAQSLAVVVPDRGSVSAETIRAALLNGCRLVCAAEDCPEAYLAFAVPSLAALADRLANDDVTDALPPFQASDPAVEWTALRRFLQDTAAPEPNPGAGRYAVAIDPAFPPPVRAFLKDVEAIRLGPPPVPAMRDVDIALDYAPGTAHAGVHVCDDFDLKLPADLRPFLRRHGDGSQRLAVGDPTRDEVKAWGAAAIAGQPGIAMIEAASPVARAATRRLRWIRRVIGVQAARQQPGKTAAPTIGWVLQKNEIRSASARYRAFHMAVALGRVGCRYSFHEDPVKLAGALKGVDAVVLVKRVDPPILELIATAKALRKPVFLDLCDDVLSPYSNRRGIDLNRTVFAAAMPDLAGIVVPSQALARNIRAYIRAEGLAKPPIFVVGDVAETFPLFKVSRRLAEQTSAKAAHAPSIEQKFASPKPGGVRTRSGCPHRIVWFGNFGSPHSNFGIPSLFAALPALEAVARDLPIELTVISNSREAFDSLVCDASFPVRWADWNEDTIHYEIHQADVALLTNGDDPFSQLKSANRALMALALGVPVVATNSPSLAGFGEAVSLDEVETGLRRYLGEGGTAATTLALEAARPILARYDLPALGRRWRRIVQFALARVATPSISVRTDPRTLVVLETGCDAATLHELLTAIVASDARALVTMTTVAFRNPDIRRTLREFGILPTLVTTTQVLGHDVRWLRGATALCLEAGGGELTDRFRGWAQARRLPAMAIRPALGDASVVSRRPIEVRETDDWLFVAPTGSEGWILDAICREIGARHDGRWSVVYNPPTLPPASTVFFAHYWNYLDHLKRDPNLANVRTFAWYTHPRPIPYSIEEQLAGYSQLTRLIFTCSEFERLWMARGLDPKRGQVVLGGADPLLFSGHARGGGTVGLSSSYYERKNPRLLYEIVRRTPGRHFHLVGRKWHEFPLFGEMLAMPNFTYQEALYAEYPAIYRTFDVFLSISSLEGGPIPLLEAMMENCVPVSSRTGFAPDLIDHGRNGFLFDVGASAVDVAALIERAFILEADVRETVIDHTWDDFARTILAMER